MTNLRLRIVTTDNKAVTAEVDPEMEVANAIDQIAIALGIKQNNNILMLKNSGLMLDKSKTFEENGIADGSELLINCEGSDSTLLMDREGCASENGEDEARRETFATDLTLSIKTFDGRRLTVCVDPEMEVADAIDQLIMELVGVNEGNFTLGLRNSESTLDESKTFKENGVANGSEFVLSTCCLYGCPTANGITGIVPECMLIREECPEYVEL